MKILLAIILIVLLAISVILISRWWFRGIKSEKIRLFMIMFMGFTIFLKVDIILSYFIRSPHVLLLPIVTGSTGALIAFIAYKYQSK
jgi:hypothetical protein